MTKRAADTSDLEVTGKVRTDASGQRVFRVVISAAYFQDIAEIAEGRANVLASKRGWKMLEGVREWPIEQSTWDGQFKTTREYTERRV